MVQTFRNSARVARAHLIHTALVFGSVGLCLVVGEGGWRVFNQDVRLTTWRNFAESRLTLFQSAYPAVHDLYLGWVPRPGYEGGDNVWGTRVTIDEDGLRSHRAAHPEDSNPGPFVLLVGDSFAFGDEVNDDDTLAARLEARLNRPVKNGGVFGYGFDQTILRAERLIDDYEAEWVIVQLVKDDLHRMMMRRRTGALKPYFDLDGESLVLNNVPVIDDRPSIHDVGLMRKVFGYSYLVDWSMRKLGYADVWYLGQWPSEYAYRDEAKTAEIACRLLTRLYDKLSRKSIRGVVVAEYGAMTVTAPESHPDLQPIFRVLQCARDTGFAVVNTFSEFKAYRQRDFRGFRKLYAQVHLSRRGNAYVAGLIARQVSALQAKGHRQQ